MECAKKKILLISEKPSLATTIRKALYTQEWVKNVDGYYEGKDYVLVYSFGHLFQLMDVDDYMNRSKTPWDLGELPFIPKEYKLKVKEEPGIKRQLAIIDKLIIRKDINNICSCGDPDEEGCSLINEIVEYSFNKNKIKKPYLRLWFTEENEESIRKDIKHLEPNEKYIGYANSSIARSRIDFIIGINQSRAISLIASGANKVNDANNVENKRILLPQGRVLGVIVKLLYDRYKQQQEFIPKNYFNIGLHLEQEEQLILKDSQFEENEKDKVYEILKGLNSNKTFVSKVIEKEVKKQPPKLFSLTQLQKKLVKMKGVNLSESETLAIVQKIYEKGYVTYPRADSEYLPENEKSKVNEVIDRFKGTGVLNIEFKDAKSIFDSEKVKTSHPAIIPTRLIPKEGDLKGIEQIVYEIIKNRFLANFCTEKCIVSETTIVISNTFNELIGELNGTIIKQKGYLVFDNNLKEKILPELIEGTVLKSNYFVNECITKQPVNVNTDELLDFLENPFKKAEETEEEKYSKILQGISIGTVATRAQIIENAKKYGYIVQNKNIYTITEKGKYFIQTSEKLGLLMTSEQTANLGRKLKLILENKLTVDECVKEVEIDIINKVNMAKKIEVGGIDSMIEEKEQIGQCPICSKIVYESSKGFYCEGLKKDCDFYINKQDYFLKSKGKTVTKSLMKSLIKKGQFNNVKVTGLKKKDGNSIYDAYIKIIKNDEYYNLTFVPKEEIIEPELGTCPRCGGKIKEGSKNFYCSNYDKGCKYSVWKENKFLKGKGIKLSQKHFKCLLDGNKMRVSGIKREDGKGTYDAFIYLEDTGEYVNIKFEITEKEKLGECPRCGGEIKEGNKNFYCSNYSKGCTYVVWKESKFLSERGIRLSNKHILSLISGKKIKIKGIKRKDGKGTYDASLYLEDTKEYVNYKFDTQTSHIKI